MRLFQGYILLIFGLFLFFAGTASAADGRPAPVLLPVSQASITLENAFEYLADPEGSFDVTDFISGHHEWVKSEQATLFLGTTKDVVWVRFHVQNPSDTKSHWILNIDWRFFDQVRMIAHTPGTDLFQEQEYLNADLPFAFKFFCPENASRTIYLRTHTKEKVILPLRIWTDHAYRDMALYRNILIGAALGVLLAMFFYNTSLFFFTSDRSYAYYSVYVFSVVIYLFAITGIGQTYLWADMAWIHSHAYGIFSSFSFLSAAIFFRKFLALKDIGGWLLYLNTIVILFWVVMMLLFITVYDQWLIDAEDIGAVISCIAGLLTATILWTRGNISAKYLTIAWSVLMLSTFILMLAISGIIEYNAVVLHSQTMGFVFEMILLSIALAERINREKTDKEAAQILTVQLHKQASDARERELKAQHKTLEVERAAKTELRQKVEQRTTELNKTLLKLETANEELGLLSRTDGLTQLSNRRYFDETYEIEFKRAQRLGLSLSVILGDIDHFKAINDTHGHQIGDECLKAVANIWSSQMARAGDLVARYGGEEFVAILPGADTSAALAIAERIRASIQTTGYTHNDQKIALTISLGVSSLKPEYNDNPTKLLDRADTAMYTAKTQGRNQVMSLDG